VVVLLLLFGCGGFYFGGSVRRQRAWPDSADVPYRLSRGRIPQLEKLKGKSGARIFKGMAIIPNNDL